MKLKVYQQGGGLIYTPFIPGTGQTTVSGTSGSSNGEDDSKIDPLDKEILALMKDNNLLPSDIQMIYKKLIAFQKKTQGLSALGLDGYRSVMPGMLQIMQMVSIAKNNKERFDKSAQLMTDREAGGELALDSRGAMWVMDNETGNVSKVMPNEFDRQQYTPLSNSQVLDLRRSHPELAFDVNSFETVGNNIIGMKQVQDEIADIVKKFGNEKNSQYVPGAIQDLAKQVAENGYFKVTVDNTRSLKDLNSFTELLWEGLGNNVRNLLSARAAISPGYNNPLDYLRDMVFAYSSQSVDKNFDASMTKAGGGAGSGSGGSEALTEDNYLIQLGNMQLTQGQAAIVPRASEVADRHGLIADVYKAGSPVDDKLNVLGPMSFSEFRTTAWAAKAGDTSSVTFGNRILRPDEYDKIMYDGASEVNVAMLPFTPDTETGKLMPDFDKILSFNEVMKELERNPGMSQTELQQLFKSKGLSINDFEPGRNGKITFKNTMPFITVSAYASDDTIPLDTTTKRFLEHLDSGSGKQIIDQFSNMLVYGKTNPAKSDKKINKHINTPERWDMYRGNIYIPMDNAHAAMLLSGKGQFVPKSMMNNYATRTEIRMAEVAANNAAKQNPDYETISELGQFKN